MLTSPYYPFKYPHQLHQRNTIRVPKGKTIKIQFTDFELERSEGDYVEVRDGDGCCLGYFGPDTYTTTPPPLNQTITSHGSDGTVDIIFHTDESGSGRGWRLLWSKLNKNDISV